MERERIAGMGGHLAFSPDGKTLAAGLADKTARLWRAAAFAETDTPDGARAHHFSH